MKSIAHLKSTKGIVDLGCVLLLLLTGCLFFSGVWQHLYWIFTPRPPILMNVDWIGSTIDVLFEEPLDTSYRINLTRKYGDQYSDTENIKQITIWYANTQDAKNAWENPQEETNREIVLAYDHRYPFLPSGIDRTSAFLVDQFYVMPLPPEITIPSSLFCYNYDYNFKIKHRTCIYFGYYEHWFTQIWFMENIGRLNDEAMFDLIKKATQIIVEAPPPVQ